MGKILLVLLLTFLTSIPIFSAAAESLRIEWIPGEVGPESWTITPSSPTVEDVIHFSGPTGVHSNSCYAEVLAGGSPALSIAPAKNTVALWFEPPPPEGCYDIYYPVCGLEGEFGPLSEGDWLFFCDNPVAQFSISFHVSAIPTYVLDVKVVGDGSVSQDPPPPYRAGDKVTLLAEPHSGWSFLKWSGDIPPENKADNPLTLTMDSDKTITATFSRLPRPLSVPEDYPTIQAAIDAAPDGDTIVVLPGTYAENMYFLGKNVTLRSTDPTDPTVVAATIIDGNQAGSVVTFTGTENETCVLSGFTIRNGKANYGAGICGGTWELPTHATIRNCVVTANEAGGEESAHAAGGGLAYCDGLIEKNTISANRARIAGLWSWGPGAGGLHACNGEVRGNKICDNVSEGPGTGGGLGRCGGLISNNEIVRNTAGDGGGLAFCDGVVRNNTIVGNSAHQWGGGFAVCDGLIESNLICSNSARNGGGLYGCEGTIRNNLIAWNAADQGQFGDQDGGGICLSTVRPETPTIVNCTIVGNSAGRFGGGVAYCYSSMHNCIIWGNVAPNGAEVYSSNAPTYSCIQDWTEGGEGNICDEPRFVDADGPDNDPQTYREDAGGDACGTVADNDYRLLPDSPCIDAGNNEAPDFPQTDIAGMPRILFGGRSVTVDMGAYEYYVNKVEASATADGIILTWSSAAKKIYSVLFSEDLISWHLGVEGLYSAGNQTTSWIDDGTLTGVPPQLVPHRFYRILHTQ